MRTRRFALTLIALMSLLPTLTGCCETPSSDRDRGGPSARESAPEAAPERRRRTPEAPEALEVRGRKGKLALLVAPSGDGVQVGVLGDPVELFGEEGALTCRWTLEVGEATFEDEQRFESPADAADLEAFCTADVVAGRSARSRRKRAGEWARPGEATLKLTVRHDGKQQTGGARIAIPARLSSRRTAWKALEGEGWALVASDSTPSMTKSSWTTSHVATREGQSVDLELTEGVFSRKGCDACSEEDGAHRCLACGQGVRILISSPEKKIARKIQRIVTDAL